MADTPEQGAAEEVTTEDGSTSEATQEEVKVDESGTESTQETDSKEIDSSEDGSKEQEESKPKGYWPEDWRERRAEKAKGKDGEPLDDAGKEKLIKRLSRYASPGAAIDAMFAAQDKIASGSLTKIPGKDATPEELTQYRQEVGIPEESKDYDLTLSDGLVIGDEDKAPIGAFLEAAHAANYTQEQVTDGLNWYYENQERIIAETHEADAKYKAGSEDVLREEWGPEFRGNINLLQNYFAADFDEGAFELFDGARLADGTPLGSNPGILRGLVAKARVANPMGALVPGSGTKQHEQMVDDIAALEKKMEKGSLKGKDQERYLKLVSLRDKVPEK